VLSLQYASLLQLRYFKEVDEVSLLWKSGSEKYQKKFLLGVEWVCLMLPEKDGL
jgi:hypothetical protein